MELIEFLADRLPGIPQGFSFTAKPGLNLLTGPNGSGKSSTARAITSLLWPDRHHPTPQHEVRILFRSGDRDLTAAISSASVRWTAAGKAVGRPNLPPDHLAGCYHLDILEIMPQTTADDDRELARILARELSGGMDPDLIRGKLFSLGGLAANRKKSALLSCRQHVQNLRKQQESLDGRRRSLAALKQKQDQARRAGMRKAVLGALKNRAEKKALIQACQDDLNRLPTGAEHIRAEDLKRFSSWRQDLQDKEAKISQTRRQLALDQTLHQTLTPPPPQGQAAALAELEGRTAELLTAETQLKEAERLLEQQQAAVQHSAQGAAGASDLLTTAATTLDPTTLKRIMETWSKYVEIHATAAADASPTQESRPDQSARWSPFLVGAGSGLLGGAAIMLWQHGPSWQTMGLAAGGALVLIMAWWQSRRSGPPAPRAPSAGPSPQEQRARKRAELEMMLAEAGLTLDLENPSGPLVLFQVKAHLKNLDNFARAEADHAAAAKRWRRELENLNAALEACGQAPVQDLVAGRSAVAGLKDTWQAYQTMAGKIQAEELDVQNLETDRTRRQGEITELLETLGLDPATAADRDLEDLLAVQPQWNELKARISGLRQAIASLDETIAQSSALFPDGDPALLTSAELAEGMAQENQLTQDYEPISQEIGALEHEIAGAMAGHALQEAMAAEENAEQELRAAWLRELEAVLGNLLLDRVTAEYRATTRPAALSGADRILQDITRQAYQLESATDETGKPSFVVHDTATNRDYSPTQLSAGTRTQLFLAVRLGFLRTLEGTISPPVILDDVLTTSDPQRFTAAVTSLGRLAAEQSLQIFYLCAHPGEVAAWQQILARDNLDPAHVIDLAATRTLAAAAPAEALAIWDGGPASAAIPVEPGSMSPAAYAAALGVPRPRIWDGAGSLHLIYLLDDDLALLHRLLSVMISTVGHWKTFGTRMVAEGALTPAEGTRLNDLITVWTGFLDLWRVGRPPRLTPEVVQNSPAISDTMLPAVLRCLHECDGDGAKLIAALRQGRVQRFRKDKVEQFAEELTATGYLDPTVALTPEETTRRLLIDSQSMVSSGRLTTETIHRLVDRLGKILKS